jgi:Mrp family chromosome partitioning ATPase
VLAGRVDAVILVVDLEASTERSVRDALRQLQTVKANVLGLVINRDRSAEPSSGYEYHVGDRRGERITA